MTGGAARQSGILIDYPIPNIGTDIVLTETYRALGVTSNKKDLCPYSVAFEYFGKPENCEVTAATETTEAVTCEHVWQELKSNQYATLDVAALTVTVHSTQEQYLTDLVPSWAPDAVETPEYIEIQARVRYFDPTSTAEAIDSVRVRYYSSGETLSANCGFAAALAVETSSAFTHPKSYDVGAGWNERLVTDELIGTDALARPDCMDLVHMTLDYLTPEQKWVTIASDRLTRQGYPYSELGFGLRVDGPLVWLTTDISESGFQRGVQFEAGTEDSEVLVNLRIAHRDDTQAVFASSEFAYTIYGPQKPSECAGLTVDKHRQARSSYTLTL